MSNFEINIKDNFFEKNLFEKIKNNLNFLKWDPLDHVYASEPEGYKHPWFSSAITDNEIKKAIKKNVCKYFKKKIIFFKLCSYTMVTKIEKPLPHNDYSKDQNYQILIYLKGNPKLTNGTGFYTQEKNETILNTHVGFFENRAVFFKTGITHSPLTWDDNSSARFSIICFLKVKNLNKRYSYNRKRK